MTSQFERVKMPSLSAQPMVTPFPALLGSEKKQMTGQFWPKMDEKEAPHNEKLVIINKTNSISCYKRLLATIRKGHLEHTVVTNSKCEGPEISTYLFASAICWQVIYF